MILTEGIPLLGKCLVALVDLLEGEPFGEENGRLVFWDEDEYIHQIAQWLLRQDIRITPTMATQIRTLAEAGFTALLEIGLAGSNADLFFQS